MSRKQALRRKKERVRLEGLEGRLERLSRQGADESFLELARGRTRELTPAGIELYGQVADRALRRALAAADLPRVQRLLSRVDRDLRSRPLAALAESVLCLAEGRLEEARTRLSALVPEEAGSAPWPRGLAEALAVLCVPGAPEGAPEAQAIRRFYRALAAAEERELRPLPAEVEALRQAAEELRRALPADPTVRRLAEAALERLRLLAGLAGLEEALAHRKGAAFLPFFLERVKGLSSALLAVLRDSPPEALLRPLHHALRLRWRDLLALVAERQGAAAWAEVHAAWPALAAVDLELVGGPEGARNRAAVRELRKAGDHGQLARLLGALAGAEKAPGRMALLWSLELWAWEQAEGSGIEEDGWLPAAAEPPQHAALVRVGRMARDLAGRLPAEQRPEVARFLRDRLFDLIERQHFCGHALEAADALLHQLPGDPGLLLVALTAAACAGDVRAEGLFAARLAARGEARAGERETVLRLVSQIALERAEVLARVLPPLRLLLGNEGWPGALEIVLRSIADLVSGALELPPGEADLHRLARDLGVYRSALADRPELEALEAAVACVRPGGGGEPLLRSLLDRTPQLEPAVVALQVLGAASTPWAPPAVGKAFEDAREAVISRLDLRWRLWIPVLPGLMIGASRTQARRLRDRIVGLLRSKGLQEEDRQALEGSLKTIAELQRIASAFRRESARAEAGPRRRKPRRKPAAEQLAFDLF